MSRLSRLSRVATLALCVSAASATIVTATDAQGRSREGRDRDTQGRTHRPPPPPRTVVLRGHVFIGGYFYDPFFGPYPWWPRAAYGPWYLPLYDRRAEVRVQVTPKQAAVYVDGFYAGIADDFDGVFEGLPLPPGGHTVVLYLEGYRTIRHNVYLRPASTFKLRDRLDRLPAGIASEPPPVAPPVPPPPEGSYRTPRTPPPESWPPRSGAPPLVTAQATGFGTLDLRVQPLSAAVTIDGQPWSTSDEGRFTVQAPAGMHRIEVTKMGYRRFTADIEVREGQTLPLNVSLMETDP